MGGFEKYIYKEGDGHIWGCLKKWGFKPSAHYELFPCKDGGPNFR